MHVCVCFVVLCDGSGQNTKHTTHSNVGDGRREEVSCGLDCLGAMGEGVLAQQGSCEWVERVFVFVFVLHT